MFKELLLNCEPSGLQTVDKLLTKASRGVDAPRQLMVVTENRHCGLRKEGSCHFA